MIKVHTFIRQDLIVETLYTVTYNLLELQRNQDYLAYLLSFLTGAQLELFLNLKTRTGRRIGSIDLSHGKHKMEKTVHKSSTLLH